MPEIWQETVSTLQIADIDLV